MKKELIDYFYNTYEENGEPYSNPTSYSEVSEFMKNVRNKNIQDLIYDIGLHEVTKSIVFNAIQRLD